MRLAEPVDQATGLRRLFSPAPVFRALGVLGPDNRATTRASIALARGLGRRGTRVLLLDETQPPHHAGGQLGVLARHTLADVARHGLVDLAQPAGDGIVLLAAPEGMKGLVELSEADLRDIAEDWGTRAEIPEWLLVNGGANGTDPGLAATADERVIVLPGRRTQLADAYATMKAAQAFLPGRLWWVLVDCADQETARALFATLAETARRFLDIDPEFLGHLPAVRTGVASSPMETQWIERLAGARAARVAEAPVDFTQYWQRMWLASRVRAESVGRDNPSRRARNAGRSSS